MGEPTRNPYSAPLVAEDRNRPPIRDWRDWVAISAILGLAIVGVSVWYRHTFKETGNGDFARNCAILASTSYGLCLLSISVAAAVGARIRIWIPFSVFASWVCCVIFCGRSWGHLGPEAVHSELWFFPLFGIVLVLIGHGALWIKFIYRGPFSGNVGANRNPP